MIAAVAQGLHGAQQTFAGTSPYIPPNKGYANQFLMPLGSRGSRIFFKIGKAKTPGAAVPHWKLTVQLTPRKLKSDGLKELVELLALATPNDFSVGALLADARVKALDVATDFVGVRPIDLWLSAAKREGKRVSFQGADGELETTYLHSFKRLPKTPTKIRSPLGTLLARCYSRDRERAAYGKPPPYSEGHTTRLEVSLKRFKAPIYLPDLASIGDPFERVRLSYVGENGELELGPWKAYLSLRRASTHADASALLDLDPKTAKKFDQALKKKLPDLIPHTAMKDLWNKGLDATGMKELGVL